MKHVFPTPTKEEIEQLELGREEADLEELPYPIMYQ
jgi:nitrate reductase delta subunit